MGTLSATILAAVSLAVGVSAAQARQGADFAVLRDGAPIGHHRVQVRSDGDETHVRVDIALDVSLGFIPLYRYRHQSHEVWRGDRLLALDSRTDDNGESLAVRAWATADGLRVDGADGSHLLPAETVPTSYWNPALVSDRPLLDSQSGRPLDVTRQPVAPGRWRLAGELNLDIAYGAQGQWSGLWFRHLGSDFAYVPRSGAQVGP